MPRIRPGLALLLSLVSLCCAPRPTAAAPNWTWIWTPDAGRAPETVFFRHTFRLQRLPVSARLLIVGDDLFTAYLNDRKQPVGRGQDWTTVQEFDVTPHLQAGANLLAVEVTNTGGAGGLLYKLLLRYPGGRAQTIFSDARVRVNRRVPPVWRDRTLDDKRWPAAREIAPANAGSWGQLRGAPMPDPTRIVRLWDIRAGGQPGADPYARPRNLGDRMLLSASVSSASDMQILAGAGFTLFQSDSNHLTTEETAADRWDFGQQDAARRLVHSLGLDWSYFPHYAFPPAWYRKNVPFTRLQCLEHRQPVEAFSLWEPAWPGFIAHGYQALAQEFGGGIARAGAAPPRGPSAPKAGVGAGKPEVAALYAGIHGDYGEAGLLMGARVSVPGQKEDWERRFGSDHNHLGWWCHDPLARADFAQAMVKQYGSLDALNAAWKRAYKSPEEIAYPERPRGEARREWLDFVAWYQGAVGQAVEFNLGAARKRFPNTLLMLPAGFGDEDPRGGNDNSLLPKLAARYGADLRSTHGGYRPFAENAATSLGRLGSASRFYGVPFWTEPPSGLTPDQEVGRLFEAVSQGAKGVFAWAGNAVDARDVFYRYSKHLRVEKPVVDVAMFYPGTSQKFRLDVGYAPLFAEACAAIRDVMNYDIVDDRMVQDGSLPRYRALILWEGAIMEQATLDKIKAWVNDGGTLLAYDFGKIQSVEGSQEWFADLFGYVRELPPARVTERYTGRIPGQYRLLVGRPEAGDTLSGDWYRPETQGGAPFRWTGAVAAVRLPVKPEKRYTLVLRVTVPPEGAGLTRRVLFNKTELGSLDSTGDVTVRFRITENMTEGIPLGTLTFRSETLRQKSDTAERSVGLIVHSVTMIEQGVGETEQTETLPGAIQRELDIRRLNTDWARRYGKGLTVYFPATRQLLKGYLEVARRLVYHLSEIDPERRDALMADNEFDGVYATLFTDKILFYNSRDTSVTKTVAIPAEKFAAWRGEVAIPSETRWTLNLEPHSIGAIYFSTPPQELLFECEKFTDLNSLKPLEADNCSPGKGPSYVRVAAGASISTRFPVEISGNYAIYARCVRNDTPEPVDILIDGQLIAPADKKAGQTILGGTVALSRGAHTLTLRARKGRDVRADYVLLTNDPTISGYGFAVRTAPVE